MFDTSILLNAIIYAPIILYAEKTQPFAGKFFDDPEP
jgi:hypothetical protein